MTALSPEQRELDLVEKVDLRILNVANNEAKLQDLLNKFLVPLLLKGASEHASVRAKVVTVTQRLKVFIKPPGIVLPVDALVKQFKSTESPVVRHLDIVFMQHSIGRLSVAERRALLPALFRGISKVNSCTAALFDILLQALAVLKVPSRGSQEDEAFAEAIGLTDPADAEYVAGRFGKVFLLSRGSASAPQLAVPADVTFFGIERVDSWLRAGTNLADIRVCIAHFLASGVFSQSSDIETANFLPALFAAVHTDSRVSSLGEDLLKRSKASLESSSLVGQLYAAHAVLPPSYRIRILGLLSRSALATSYTDDIINAVQRNMRSSDAAKTVAESAGDLQSQGLQISKLYKALFEYINWIARVGPKQARNGDFVVGRTLIEHLQRYIANSGWPVPMSSSVDSESLRAKAYETIGMLASGAKMTMVEQVELASYLFRSLTEDPTADAVVSIDSALSSLATVFIRSDITEVEDDLRAVLLKYIYLADDNRDEKQLWRGARHAAAKWANNCLRPADPIARWIDILAVAGHQDERSDVIEEGHRGLDPWTYLSNNIGGMVLPKWEALVYTFFKQPICIASGEMDIDGVSVFVNFPGDIIKAFPLALNYCKLILFATTLNNFKFEPGWEQHAEALSQSDESSRETIRAYLASSLEMQTSLRDLLEAAFQGMLLKGRPAFVESCSRCFVELASLAPLEVLSPLSSRAAELLPLVTANEKSIRQLAAASIGILGAHPHNAPAKILELKTSLIRIAEPWKKAVGSDLNATEGAFVALSHLISRIVFYTDDEVERHALVDIEATILPTAEEIGMASTSFRDAMIYSLSQIWTAGIQCLPRGDDDKDKAVRDLTNLLSSLAKNGNEHAIFALGRLAIAVGDDSKKESSPGVDEDACDVNRGSDTTALILSKLYGLYEIKQTEVQLAIGGAITAAVSCWDADVVELSLDVPSTTEKNSDANFRTSKRSNLLSRTLDKLLADSKTTKPALLKATGIWLFTLIQHSAHLLEIQSRLRACQAAFMRLLGARDELVQETASRGLALVYEKGDASLKGDLVRDLVASFTGNGSQLKVDEDTELFEAGALPTGEGKSVTSYRDIVNLANEVGDQTLIYKFMSLATNAATWSTRSAFGRFGLSNILSSEDATVDPKLYPKLFRYRFDPNPNVQRSMNDIWKAVVKDSKKVIEENFSAIMEDLLNSILSKEWRVRQASAAAVSDLVQGRPFAQYARFYHDIWARALKVLDDVKGSVREVALRLCIALSNMLVRQLEEGDSGGGKSGPSKSAAAMMSEALPFLLSEKGIESGVEDVKVFSTLTVLKIAKHGGTALRPYISAMVPHLLGLLSTIEPQAFNYYYMRSGDDDRAKLDKMRSAMVSQSPISEAIENSLRFVDADVLKDLAPGIETAIKIAVGMPTKIGCSRVIQTLATRHALDFASYAPRFLQVLQKQLLDRNDEVSQSYAKSAAYVLRPASDAARLKFVTHLADLYFASEDENRRQKAADAVLAIAKISPDHFSALESHLLPFVFFTLHDTDEYVRKAADEVWSNHAGSSLSVARYVPEIATLVRRALDTAQWALKHAGARTTAAALDSVLVAGATGLVNVRSFNILWPLYQSSMALKTFNGKEELLEVLPIVASKANVIWQGDHAKIAVVLRKMATVEAKRNNDAYRLHAFRCLWRVSAALDNDAAATLWNDLVAIVTPHLQALNDLYEAKSDDMDLSEPKTGSDAAAKEKLVRQTAEIALEAVARGYFRPAYRNDPRAVLADIWNVLSPFVQNNNSYLLVRRTKWYKAGGELLQNCSEAKPCSKESGDVLALSYLTSFDVSTPEAGTEDQRMLRAKALKALSRACKKGLLGSMSSETMLEIKAAMEGALSTERSLDVQKLLGDAIAEARK
ncbi:proteasome component M29 [Sporothrix epigloea]|uniref:Proteasome component M29 n=1 Tax=Sporothrix epigloea TaxID=1892477 RepID=A0ABP0DJU0_9PEZI